VPLTKKDTKFTAPHRLCRAENAVDVLHERIDFGFLDALPLAPEIICSRAAAAAAGNYACSRKSSALR
jgi:hypothetical protein